MANQAYFEKVKLAAEKVKEVMAGKDFHITFGGEGQQPKRKPTAPTGARSEFLANRALGDWAERSLAAAIRSVEPAWGVVHYGQSDSISAGNEGLKEFYLAQLELVRKYGKRPDILIFDDKSIIEEFEAHDISMVEFNKLDGIAKKAIASIEVRSSKVEAIKYIEVRKQDRAAGKSNTSTRETPSFTVKTEDLVIVYRWLERYKIPQTYCQVFFDSVWGMNVLDIFVWIGQNNFKIDNPDKSQGKATILIPITEGIKLGMFDSVPEHTLHPRVSRLGRHDTYIEPVFKEGSPKLDREALKKIVLRT